MKKQFSILAISLVVVAVLLSVGFVSASQTAPRSGARKIIVFQPWFVNEAAREKLIDHTGGVKIKSLDLINAMAVYLPSKASEKALEGRPEILRIDNDDLVFALGKPGCNNNGTCEKDENWKSCPSDCPKPGGEEEPTPTPTPSAEEMAWGVDRIDADAVWPTNKGTAVKVAIIDSGIDADHPDLVGNIKNGYNAINSRKSWDDDNGHGTHVAGIVAAVDNDIGVIGTAPEAYLYAVKVLNRRGIGFTSDIIDGLNWCIEKGMQVANMSIGSSGCSQSYEDAIRATKDAGVTIVAAAGNNGETDGSIVCPAILAETIAVSATNESDGLAYFSSYGKEVNLAAPGQAINSTWNDGYYHIGSGTSMATPHVAGTAALILADPDLKCDQDFDGLCTPNEVQQRLESTAEWLPGLTSDQQGSGLVDAEKAVQ